MSDFEDERWVPDDALSSLSMEADVHPDETHVERAKRLLTENVDVAAASLIWLARSSTNERIRLEASRSLMDRVIGRAGDAPVSGALDEMFEKLDNLANMGDSQHKSHS